MEDDATRLLHEAAWQVYAVPPGEFVTTRTAWVRRLRGEGHREAARAVGALRKPSVSAAAVNALARSEDPVLPRLREVGSRLRHAQSALDGAGLAALRGERDALLTDWVAAARQHAPGGSLTAAVEAEVRDTAVAALADEAATEVVLSGTLTRALSYSGFGEVDVADAVARTSTGVVLTRIEGGRGEDEDEGEDGQGNKDEGEGDDDEPEPDAAPESDEPDEAPEDDAEPEDALADLREEVERAESEVAEARDRRRAAAAEDGAAGSRMTEAEQAVEAARQVLEAAEQQLREASEARSATAEALSAAEAALSAARARRDTARQELEEAEDAG
ncbi:hypothetical protein [Ornithinimicrobium flavum]|uniref:hypothetical protein n=1 Tax=Ornithinimicrobium flavum TaxID=1288636 RepID=UPI00106F3EB2|nr:hypothetical protein [Ornithinimicrobium flavum]